MYTKHPAASVSYSLDKKFETFLICAVLLAWKIFSEKSWKFFRILIAYFSGKKMYNNDIVSNVRKTCCPVG